MRSSRPALALFALATLAAGCTCKDAPPSSANGPTPPALEPVSPPALPPSTAEAGTSAALLNEAMQALNEREARVTSYHVVADSLEGEAAGHHEFFYRAPDKVRGVVTAPVAMTLSFDGRRLFRLVPSERKLMLYNLKLSPDRGALLLAQNFQPFVPEGYRAPLIPRQGSTAKKVTHPKGPEAWEISTTVTDGTERMADITYVLRIPTGDFLGKIVTTSAGTEVTEVEDEFCDAARRVCVPKKVVTRTLDRAVVHSVTMSRIELGVPLPGDDFVLQAPEGYATETHDLLDKQ